jgi:hypothetical protein
VEKTTSTQFAFNNPYAKTKLIFIPKALECKKLHLFTEKKKTFRPPPRESFKVVRKWWGSLKKEKSLEFLLNYQLPNLILHLESRVRVKSYN